MPNKIVEWTKIEHREVGCWIQNVRNLRLCRISTSESWDDEGRTWSHQSKGKGRLARKLKEEDD